MRYAVISDSLSFDTLMSEVIKVQAKNVRSAILVNEIFCELSEDQVHRLSAVPGIEIKRIHSVRPTPIFTVPVVEKNIVPEQIDPMSIVPTGTVWDVFTGIRALFSPPLSGIGLTVAVLDTGIRNTHESLHDKIIYEKNFSSSSNTDDVFGHGTPVAFVVAGGVHGSGITGVSPGASIMNIKVMDNSGNATEEDIVLGIEHVCELVLEAHTMGLHRTAPMWPNVINLSLGADDDGDENNPMRKACRVASREYGMDVVAAAGNYGPNMTTITIPGTEPEVITVGAIKNQHEIEIWEQSSRGPTIRGDIKPDFVFWGNDIKAASNTRDNNYDIKSGTSFAAPMLSGLTGLLWETGRLTYGGTWMLRWTEIRNLAHLFCVKPENTSMIRDNVYGYGLPSVDVMIDELARTKPPVYISNVDTLLTPMLLLSILMRLIK